MRDRFWALLGRSRKIANTQVFACSDAHVVVPLGEYKANMNVAFQSRSMPAKDNMPELVNSAAQLQSVFIKLWPWLSPSEVLGRLKLAAERVVELPIRQGGHVTGPYLSKESGPHVGSLWPKVLRQIRAAHAAYAWLLPGR